MNHKLANSVIQHIFGTITNTLTPDPVAAITFDDGPHPIYTSKLLDLLSNYNAKATFFVLGQNAEKYPKIIKRITVHAVQITPFGKFYIYKFRTMVYNAEKLRASLVSKNETDGPIFKIKDDPRITRVGKLLRKTGLDELPQLFNVLKGEMSLIGPRPPIPQEVEKYERWQLKRLSVKPGITCTWQVIPNRHDILFEKWMKLDIQYIENWSIKKDFVLIFKTIKSFFTPTGH